LAHLFRWRRIGRKRILPDGKISSAENEVADILIYLLSLCIELGIDPEAAVRSKLKENEKRFPVERFNTKTGQH
jgi:NTP pyrophosphatase (non-canonical NTP hydrolase)